MTTSRECLIYISMSVLCTFNVYTKDQLQGKELSFESCSELDSKIIFSECRKIIVGALEGTRLELGVRLYWYNTAVQNFTN